MGRILSNEKIVYRCPYENPLIDMIDFIKRKIRNLIYDKKFSEILTGFTWAFSARVLATCFGLVTTIIIARVYGAKLMGIVAVLNSFIMMVTIFTVLGTNTSILRLIPEHLAKYSPSSAFKLYRKTQYIVIGVSLITSTLFFFSANLIADKVFSKPHLSFYFYLATVFIVFNSLTLLNTQAIRGLRLIRIFAFMQILPQGFNLILLILLGILLTTQDVPIYALFGGFVLTGTIGWVIMEYVFKKRMQTQDPIQPISVKEILSISLPMLMSATMTFIIGQTGVIMLGIFRSEVEVGYYAIAVKLATLTTFILSAITSMVAPKFSELFHTGKIDELFYVAKKSAKLIFYTTSPILIGLIFFGKPVLIIAFGHEYAVAYPAMALLAIGQFVHSISGATGTFMNMTDQQKILRNISLVVAVINILLNVLLIPSYGINGAAFSGMISLSFWNYAILRYIKSKHGRTTSYFPILA